MKAPLALIWLLLVASVYPQSLTVNGDSVSIEGGRVVVDVTVTRPRLHSAINSIASLIPRTLPPGFPELPVMPAVVRGPGDLDLDQNLFSAFYAKYGSALSGTAWVDPVNGSDKTGVVGNESKPFATISTPLRDTAAQVIVLADGAYAPFDFRSTDRYGSFPKVVLCEHVNHCIIRNTGTDLASALWSASAYASVYVAKIASDGVTSTGINRVLLQDGTLDAAGFPQRLPISCYDANNQQVYSGCVMANSLAALSSSKYGWFYDTVGHNLYVALGGEVLPLQHVRARVRATYYDLAHNSRILASGTTLMLFGLYLDGIDVLALEQKAAGGYIPAELWSVDNTYFASGGGYGAWVLGSRYFERSVSCHATLYDCINGDSGAAGYLSTMLSAHSVHDDAGDVETYGTNVSNFPNKNGSSSHSGYHVSFGSIYQGNRGPEFADTSEGPVNLTWAVASIARNAGPDNFNPGGFAFYGDSGNGSANRQAWLDTCASYKEDGMALFVNGGASVKLFNSTFDSVTVKQGSILPAAYTPSAP